MKIKNLFFAALSILILAACTETPDSPYDFPGIGGNDNPTEEGTNLLVNSDFETWENNVPTGWGQTVSNCTYTQSTDAHSGSSAVVVEGYSQSNKRFASKSYTLKPGTYTISAYLKKSGETLGQYRLGYAKLTNGVVADTQNDYIYITSATTVPSDWKKATCNFTIDAETEVGIIIMNSKYGEGASILVDDVTLTTTDGGLVEGTDEPETPTDAYISETFATSFGAFTTQETVGNYPWIIDYSTAKATSYIDTDGDGKADTDKEATSWLVSPTIDLTNETEAYIAFEYIIRYAESGKVADNHQLLICSDFSGDVATASWTNIPYGAVEGVDWNTFYKANVAVPAEFLGKSTVTFALRYTATTKAGTWEVKNFVVAHGAATGETPEEPETPETPDTPVVPSGENMLANGSFEDWSGNVPTGWGGPVGSNATISQNTDANTGNYSVLVAGAAGNKRLTSKSYFLAPGTYTLAASFKQSDANAGMFRLGYLKLTNGAIANTQTDYKYITEPAAVTAEWTQTAAEFTLTETTEVAIIIMNSKNGNGASFLVDDVILTTTDGGITEGGEEEGGEEPETPSADKYDFTAVTSVTAGAQYLIVAGTNQATALDASKSYGYLPVTTVNPSNGVINTTDDNVFVIEAVDGGYSIKDALGRYLYMKGEYNSVNLDTTLPAEGGVWTIEFNADGTAKITNTYNRKFMQFDSQYNSYGIYPDARGTMPTLYKKN